jgi:two-component system, NtrC family, nitrogen regulation sensor histidine kinase NtrY
MQCDNRQLGQAISNILKNAEEAIQQREDKDQNFQGKITTRLYRDGDKLNITVQDNGIGLPIDLRERLTEPYVTTRPKGTGLGLAIVKKITEDHFGQLIVASAPTGGALITLSFDLTAAAEKTIDTHLDETNHERRVSHGA